jgi:hypothetical protein
MGVGAPGARAEMHPQSCRAAAREAASRIFNPDVKHFTRLPPLARASMAAPADLAPATCH